MSSTPVAIRPADTAPGSLLDSLRRAPATVPALAAIALFVVWLSSQAGYPLTHWAPGGLIVLALLAIAIRFVGLPFAELPTPVKVALACFAAYTALSFCSILWAAVPADAWEGANRTLLYLLVFALFALWPQHGRSAALLLTVFVLATACLALFVILHASHAAGSLSRLEILLPGGRLTYPSGYANANAAQWLIAFWPALLLAREPRLSWALRGLFAAGAVLLAEAALLSVSRGALYATPIMVVLVFAFLPSRLRTFALLVPIAAGIAAAAPSVLRVGERIEHSQSAAAAVHSAVAATLIASVAVGLIVAAGAAIEGRIELSQASATRARRALGGVAIAALFVVLAGGLAAAGNPVNRARHAWDTFKSGSGYAANGAGNRLTSGFGSNRYDFYRVALDEFLAHPVVGIGADNFQQQYLAHGRSEETPHYPHSVELRTLTETGLLGGLLACVGLVASLLAGWQALRRADPLGRAVAAAALSGFAYWLVHGSFDWFFEFAGLGAPAFAMLGLSCALAPRGVGAADVLPGAVALDVSSGAAARARAGPGFGGRSREKVDVSSGAVARARVGPGFGGRSREKVDVSSGAVARARAGPGFGGRSREKVDVSSGAVARARVRRVGVIAGGSVLALAIAATFLAPWLSRLWVESAARIWPKAPAAAYARLNDAASLNPLSDEPYVVAGSIALRFGDLTRADHEFALALARTPGDAYATLERGAVASAQGRKAAALVLLEEAVRLNPRDPLAREALAVVHRGERIDVEALNRSILRKARQLA